MEDQNSKSEAISFFSEINTDFTIKILFIKKSNSKNSTHLEVIFMHKYKVNNKAKI